MHFQHLLLQHLSMEPESIFIAVAILVILLLVCLRRRRRRGAGGAEREVKEEFTSSSASSSFADNVEHRNSVFQVSRTRKRDWVTATNAQNAHKPNG